MLAEKYGWAIQKNLFAQTNQDSTFSHTRENSKMLNITSNYFSFFNNKPPPISVAHITKDFLTCYSCSYCSSMLQLKNKRSERKSLFQPLQSLYTLTMLQRTKLFYLRCSCKTLFSNQQGDLKVIKNSLPDKSENSKSLKKIITTVRELFN